jgi:GGDEF domain-containing protein
VSVLTVALDDTYAPVSMAVVVRVLGDLVRGVVGETGLVGRSGRGKFVAMASGGAEGLAKRLHDAVRAQSWDILVGEGQVPRVSIGAADTRQGERVDGVMLRADGALSDARKRGGDQVVTASTEPNRPSG